MISSAFKILSEIQWRSKKKRRLMRYTPCTCRACGYAQAYREDEYVCESCGTIGNLEKWRTAK